MNLSLFWYVNVLSTSLFILGTAILDKFEWKTHIFIFSDNVSQLVCMQGCINWREPSDYCLWCHLHSFPFHLQLDVMSRYSFQVVMFPFLMFMMDALVSLSYDQAVIPNFKNFCYWNLHPSDNFFLKGEGPTYLSFFTWASVVSISYIWAFASLIFCVSSVVFGLSLSHSS